MSILNNGVVGAAMRGRYDNGKIKQHLEISDRECANAITTVQKDCLVCEQNKQFAFPPKQPLKLKLKDMLEENVDEKFYLSERRIQKIANWRAYQKPFEKVQGKNSIVPTLTARGAGEEHSGMITYSENLEDTTNLQEECLKVGLFDDTSSNNFAKGKRDYGYKNEYGTLKCSPKYSIYKNIDLRIRKLTPKECWRLMGFDDSDYEKASKVNSNTQLYKQAGNSIVVNVLVAIFKELIK